ncbi:hypothetical protein EVAR_95403_1 [Eumeta japonica]|uniref:Uncharacterized protein n=1 Tax=Eumeta variegata TaxID=151549 RepID=A0A4C1VIN2_EUMVA|nr:hypothetical protein EVAR_95403_1 [Eumeta japonica]
MVTVQLSGVLNATVGPWRGEWGGAFGGGGRGRVRRPRGKRHYAAYATSTLPRTEAPSSYLVAHKNCVEDLTIKTSALAQCGSEFADGRRNQYDDNVRDRSGRSIERVI